MQYALLIYDDDKVWESLSKDEIDGILGEYFAYSDELRSAGAHVGGEALQGVDTATTVRVRDGEQLITDGPFAETKEQLGGFYVIEADSIDEAIRWAAKIPSARLGSIEVRPVMVFDREEVSA